MRKVLLLLTALVLVAPGIGSAQLDPTGCGASATRISGHVESMVGSPLPNILIRVFSANTNVSSGLPASTFTNGTGFYTLCLAGFSNGLDYEVQASDPLKAYETRAQPFDVTSGITAVTNVDFTLPYRLVLLLTPNAIKNDVATTMGVSVRSAAPPSLTTIHASFDVLGDFILTSYVTEGGGSPFYAYTTSVSIPTSLAQSAPNNPYWVSAFGTLGATKWTSTDRQPFVVDKTTPSIAPDAAGSFGVGGSTPTTPRATSTTNPQPNTLVAIQDTIAGVDPQTVTLDVDGIPHTPTITGTAARLTVYYTPYTPLALGPHTFHYVAYDYAGNMDVKSFTLTISVCCGTAPIISAPGPGPIHVGSNALPAPVVGTSVNNTYPEVTCYITDPDGQYDIAAGTIRVRLLYNGIEKAHYDPTQPMPGPNSATDPNTGTYAQNTGLFKLKYNYALGGTLPGIYTVVAEVSDHGGNSTSFTWEFLLVAGV